MTPEPRLPDLDGLHADFYAHARDGVLHLQRCCGCGRYRHPPRYGCPGCVSQRAEWVPAAGVGTLYSWAITHAPFDRGWAQETPYTTAVVELAEGPRIVGAIDDDVPLELGAPVRATVTPMGETFAFVRFRRA